MVFVGQERERQFELLAERALACRSLRAHAPDVGAALVDGLVAVAELACLDGAAGRVVLGVEVEDRPPATLVGKTVHRPGLVGKSDLGREVADSRHAHRSSLAGDSTTSSRPRRTTPAASAAERTFDRPRACPSGSGSSTSG